ncbi:MAG: ribosome-associated heat shock protein Hsp15 [Gammaproteobacteria bacterium]|jgi:ribosome-associated heat shock protein Hsp15
MSLQEDKVRIDKWLWAARFYKTRALARQAITGGKVHLSGQRIKPSRTVKLKDIYQIQRGYDRLEVVVESLCDRRGSATIAITLYNETPESVQARKSDTEKRKLAALQRPKIDHKPNKQERRKIRQFTGKS